MSGLTLKINEFVPAAPDLVFAAWTSESELLQWWGPPGGSCSGAKLDLRAGGQYRLTNKLTDGSEMEIWGEFITVDVPHYLEYTWSTQLDQPATERVSVRFTAEGEGTRVAVSHRRIDSAETLATHEAGWRSCLARLTKAL